ncbi:MAG: spore maturation protein [Oscillospiraceae bacterium]|nr:spore maturation protein [Oscillospiraceae bacterium]
MLNVWIIPIITAFICIYALVNKCDVFSDFLEGAEENLKMCIGLLPTLIAIITAIGMLRASGAVDMLTGLASGLLGKFGFPAECLPLALIRPISGSGALAVYEEILTECAPDSFAGRVASVMLGATETTFYTIAVYFSAVKIKKTRHTLPAALLGDITGFIVSVLMVNIFFGR